MNSWSRHLIRETKLSANNFILPLFITEGSGISESVPSMQSINRFSIDLALEQIKQAMDLGIKAVALFPVIHKEKKSVDGLEALNRDNLICRSIREIKNSLPEIGIIADVALDPYTNHGHDGIVRKGEIANDETVAILKEQSLILAETGCDVIAPSDMMDGRIGAIRDLLESSGYYNTIILSYAVKFASSLYGPFRHAIGSQKALAGSSKSTYQMDYANKKESLREVALDIQEGADAVMIKPALAYLDIIKMIAENYNVPIFAYHVSGEYAMVKNAGLNKLFNAENVMMEHLTAIKRAGASSIITYAAIEIAQLMEKDGN